MQVKSDQIVVLRLHFSHRKVSSRTWVYPANIFLMRAFYAAYEKVSQAVTQLEELPIFSIPWGHNVVLIHKLKSNEQHLWYAKKAFIDDKPKTTYHITAIGQAAFAEYVKTLKQIITFE